MGRGLKLIGLRTIDFHITLTAADDVTFGDTKEGAFAIRLADKFTAKQGGTMSNAEGQTSMANVWGKRSGKKTADRWGTHKHHQKETHNAPLQGHRRERL